MKKDIIPVVLVLALVLAGCQPKVPPAETAEAVTPVETTTITKTTIQKDVVYAGQVRPMEQIYVVPKMAGKVARVNFDVGDAVDKDDILFELDDTDLQGSISAAAAQYDASLAGIDTAQAGLDSIAGAQAEATELQLLTTVKNTEITVETAEIGIENAQLAVSNAQLTLDNVSTSYENSKLLYEAGTISKTDFDKVELSYNQALAAFEQAELALAQAEASKNQAVTANNNAQEAYDLYVQKTKGSTINQALSSVNQASAGAEVAKAALDNATRTLDDLIVRSPLAGVVTARNVSEGSMASPSSPAFTIMYLDSVEVETNVSEDIINAISLGMAVPVNISSVSDEPYEGYIGTISPAADEIRNTFPVKIVIDNPRGLLKPGMFAEIRFIKEISQDTIVLPRNTVLSDAETSYVFAAENGAAKKYIVETGIDNGKDIEIISGITDGDKIITTGQTRVSDGDKIKIVAEHIQSDKEEASDDMGSGGSNKSLDSLNLQPEEEADSQPNEQEDSSLNTPEDSPPEELTDSQPEAEPESQPDTTAITEPEEEIIIIDDDAL